MGASGGIQDSNPIPANTDPTERSNNPSDVAFPLRLFEGTLTNGVDALVISPTLWEEDGGNQAYQFWSADMDAMTPQLFQRPEIQDQLARGSFAPFLFGSFAVPGRSNLENAALGAATMGISFVGLALEGLFDGRDRPIGLVPSGLADSSVVLPNQVVLLTREIIEAALAPLPPGTAPIGPPAWPRFPKPGVMMIPFRDGQHGLDRPAYYEMYLKVERLP